MAKRHSKHCTFKRTEVCICANIEAALADQAKKHEEAIRELRAIGHKHAQQNYRDQIIQAFTNLIDGNFQIEQTYDCKCSRWDY